MTPGDGGREPLRVLTEEDLTAALEWFWHPVATIAEIERAGGVMAARLLGRDLAIAALGGSEVAALTDRCPHRSTRLSVGCVSGGALRCAYHGWRWDAEGRCVEIPSAPTSPIPSRFRQQAYEARTRYGIVWVRVHPNDITTIPPMPAEDEPDMRVIAGEPYTWPTAAGRRVENFVDFAHFAWVHDGTLGNRDYPVPPEADVARVGTEMRFGFEPAPLDEQQDTALFGASSYRMPMPLTVNIAFDIEGRPGAGGIFG